MATVEGHERAVKQEAAEARMSGGRMAWYAWRLGVCGSMSGLSGQFSLSRLVGGALVAALAVGSGACVVNETAPPARGVVVNGPPPEPVKEPPPATQRAGSIWLVGYWHWSGMQYTWIPGHWERAPVGQSWHTPKYSMQGGTYVYEPGGWR